MDSLTFKYLSSIEGIGSGDTDNPGLNCPIRATFNCILGSNKQPGTGAFGDQALVLQNYSLTANSYIEVDLVHGTWVNILKDVISHSDAFATVRFLAIVHEQSSGASQIRFGGAVTTGGMWGGLLGDPDNDTLLFKPGQFNIMGSPTNEGMPIQGEVTPNPTVPFMTAFMITNLDTEVDATISIYVVGEKRGS